jgi:hypothetical protein
MSNYTSKKLAFNNAEQFKESFFEPEPATLGYIFLGNHVAWPNEDAPTTAVDTVSNEKSIWDNMFAGKKITGNDVELVIPRVDWVANKKYREYDDTIDLTELITSNTAQNLGPVYVMNSDRNVYLCLSNNTTTANSTVEPTGKNFNANGIIQTADSYVWKYLYNIKPSNRFFSNNWIPAPTSTAKLDYDTSSLISVDGELTNIVVVSGGSGYKDITISVSAFAAGCTILSIANTTNLTANMAVSGTGIASGTHIESVDTVNTKIQLSSATTNSGGGTGNNVSFQSRVYISGDGIGGVASVVLSGNSVSDISVSSYGKDYSVANVYIYGTGTGAQVRAVLPPKFGHGYNPAKQLGASNVMVAMRIGEVDSTEGGIISTDTTFRQYGLLRDPYKYGETVSANTSTANTVFSQTTNLTVIAGTAFNLNEFVYQGPSSTSPTFSGYVHASSANQIRLTKVRGSISVGNPLKGTETNPSGRTVVTYSNPEFEPNTGDILYEENIVSVQRTDGQAESLKFVIRF